MKNPRAMQEMQGTWALSLGQEDPLEKDMTTHSSILAWKIPWTEEPGRLQSMGLQRVGHLGGTRRVGGLLGAHRMSVFTYVQAYVH